MDLWLGEEEETGPLYLGTLIVLQGCILSTKPLYCQGRGAEWINKYLAHQTDKKHKAQEEL